MTTINSERFGCPCTEEWYEIPGCEPTRYAYAFWIHPECEIHWAPYLETMSHIEQIRKKI